LLRAFRRRQMLALGLAILVTALAGPAAWFLVPPAQFRAYARLHVASSAPRIIFSTVDNTSGQESHDQTTQLTLVKRQLVLEAALKEVKDKNLHVLRDQVDPRAWLRDALQVGFIGGSEVMEISLNGDNAQEITDLVNAVKEAYAEESVDTNGKRRVE